MVATIIILATTALGGCEEQRVRRYGNYFYYLTTRQNGAAIIELTELGQRQRVLVIPEMIGGRRVRIGRDGGFGIGAISHPLQSDYLKKVFFQQAELTFTRIHFHIALISKERL
ncbi:MAG: hypothetical protein FWC02_03635 [Firmicutes bacterium]|nr:hypothetical protein [Bacillota bacterium]